MAYETKTDGKSGRSMERQQRDELNRVKRAFWKAVQDAYVSGDGPWDLQQAVPEAVTDAINAIVETEYRLTDQSLQRSIGITDQKLNDAAHHIGRIAKAVN